MGNAMRKRFGRKSHVILMLGLDCAGRTVILYLWKYGEVVTTIPTIGFNVENVKKRGKKFWIWDLSGGEKVRHLYQNYYTGTKGLIYVIDSADIDRLDEAIGLLEQVITGHEQLAGIPVVVFAHKQDLQDAMAPDVIAEKIDESGILRHHKWKLFGTSVKAGQGKEELFAGLDWLASQLHHESEPSKMKKPSNKKRKSDSEITN